MASFSAQDYKYMARALRLAEHGRYTAHPNPIVGCVIVRGDDVVGEGWHARTGEAHAEVNAIRDSAGGLSGSTAYVSLEPCSHHGKTPPCAEALIDARIARVVVAMQDPNPIIAGRGIDALRAAGLQVDVGLLASSAELLNPGFISRVTRERPFVRLKLAASLDGAIAMSNGESQWITGKQARADVQKLRARCGAILTGIGTVLADDPSLNVRAQEIDTQGLQPVRVILDSNLRMPPAASMLAHPGRTLVCCANDADGDALRRAGAEVKRFGIREGRVDIAEVLADLAVMKVNDVLVEAGPGVAGALLEQKLVDELVIYQAPHIMGSETLRLLDTPTWDSLADRQSLKIIDERRVGRDSRITAQLDT